MYFKLTELNGRWYWRLHSSNRFVIARGPAGGYCSELNARRACERLVKVTKEEKYRYVIDRIPEETTRGSIIP
jgi:uncharacterized protein YegP (UPF0339 family)